MTETPSWSTVKVWRLQLDLRAAKVARFGADRPGPAGAELTLHAEAFLGEDTKDVVRVGEGIGREVVG